MEQIITTGTDFVGGYIAQVVISYYADTLKNGKKVWKRGDILARCYSKAKVLRLAQEIATSRGLQFRIGIRHLTPVCEKLC